MNFEVIYTSNFKQDLKRLAKKYRSVKSDLTELIDDLEENPMLGTAIRKDCYKFLSSLINKTG